MSNSWNTRSFAALPVETKIVGGESMVHEENE